MIYLDFCIVYDSDSVQTCPERFGIANESGSNPPRAISLHVVRGLQTWNYWHLHSMHDRGLLILWCEEVLIRGEWRVGNHE